MNIAKKTYYERHKQQRQEYARIYYLENKEIIDKKNHEWSLAHRGKRAAAARRYSSERLRNDENYALNKKYKSMLGFILRKLKEDKFVKSELNKILCCTTLELKFHIESKFKDGMSWGNYGAGGWHIDHIKPRCLFDLRDRDQLGVCFHYSNLQPLWESENRKKGRSI